MKLTKVLLMVSFVVCAVCAPMTAQVTFSNSDGTFTDNGGNTIGTSTLSLSGSTLTNVSGLTAFGVSATPPAGSTVTFTTGTLATGNITGMGGTFNAGGTFTINYGNGVIFTGTFANATWNNISIAYNFTGQVNGTLFVPGFNPVTVMGATVQLTTLGATWTGNKITDGTNNINGTTFNLPPGGLTAVAPEPGTLTLLGTGLVSLGVFFRRVRNGATDSK